MSRKQTRLALWAIARSTSSAFFRAMMNRKNTEVLFEPFARPYYFGPDRLSSRYDSVLPIQEEDTVENIKALCELPYPDADEVFFKELAYTLVHQPGYINLLPTGYIHTFLIRHPMKAIPSLYKASTNKEGTGWDHFDPREVGYKELYQMLELVTTKLGQAAIIVDADDLIAHPSNAFTLCSVISGYTEDILRQYCSMAGIDFQQSMLEWTDDPQNHPVYEGWLPGWFEHLLASKGFDSTTLKPIDPLVIKMLPGDVRKSIEDSMPYYDEMYTLRIKPAPGSE